MRRDTAAAEVTELEAEYARTLAAGQLAGVLEERLKDGTYRSRLGLMSRVHDDFQKMAELLAATGEAREASGVPDELPVIDRIVLYIDDLDRCPPRRVVEVLEAIHLLLAINLFVVVVAVDPRWLLRALTSHYRHLLSDPDGPPAEGSDHELWRSTPMHYLEKIFQIPFTLAPLDTTRYERLVTSLIEPETAPSRRRAPPRRRPLPAPPRPATRPPRRRAVRPPMPGEQHEGAATGLVIRPAAVRRLPQPPSAQQLDPLVLHADEQAFLKLLGPPLVTTPRSVKRVLNSYGLLLALAQRDRRQELIGPSPTSDGRQIRPHRAVLTLLAAVVGAPDEAPALFRDLAEACLRTPDQRWDEYLVRQRGAVKPLVAMLETVDAAGGRPGGRPRDAGPPPGLAALDRALRAPQLPDRPDRRAPPDVKAAQCAAVSSKHRLWSEATRSRSKRSGERRRS